MKQISYLFLICVLPFLSLSAQKQSDAARKLSVAEYAITNLYVDVVDENKMVEAGIIKMLEQLDPHSTYISKEELSKMNEPLKGNFEGIGIQFSMMKDTLFVIQTIAGGPSVKAGILSGDRIVSVNDTLIAGVRKSTPDIMKMLRGEKGTIVRVKVLRRGFANLLEFKIKRDQIPIYSLEASFMADKQIGYIKISRFAATTHDEFKEAFKKLQAQGMKSLILDLQSNGGGYLNTAIELANEFLEQDELIVYTEGLRSSKKETAADGTGKFKKGRLAILIDEYAASASEIVSGAIQDWDRGIIVGRRSYGKGLVQRPVGLPDGSEIRLTIARYYTPTGRCIQKPYDDLDKFNKDLTDRFTKGELSNLDSIHFPDSLQFKTKKLARVVYGGGGIMPDYFVPLDTLKYTHYHRQLTMFGTLNTFALNYVEQKRAQLKQDYPLFELYDANFKVDTLMLNQLLVLAAEDKIPFNKEQYERSIPAIQNQVKALIARDLWEMTEFYRIANRESDIFVKAVALLKSNEYDTMFLKKSVKSQK